MMALPSPQALIKRYGLSANKMLGQHYLLNPEINQRIAEEAGAGEKTAFIEIGSGPGSLTCALLEAGAAHIWAIERDRRFIPPLGEISAAAEGRLEVIEGDALAVDYAPLATKAREQGWQLCFTGNLPYQVASPLILRWLASAHEWGIAAITVLIQEEMARRLTAAPNHSDYGRFSVICQFQAAVELLFRISAGAFTPPPKVDGRLVRLIPHSEAASPCLRAWLERATQAGFGQRRKMLRQSLRQLADDGAGLAEAAGLNPEARAETIPLAGWIKLAKILAQRGIKEG